MSGTNAHVILEEAAAAEPCEEAAGASEAAAASCLLVRCRLCCRARARAALAAQARRLAAHLEAHPELSLGDVAHSLATTRTQFEHARGGDRAGACRRCWQRCRRWRRASLRRRRRSAGRMWSGKVVFVFPGQGSQWPQMAQGLLAELAGVSREHRGVRARFCRARGLVAAGGAAAVRTARRRWSASMSCSRRCLR